MQIKGWLHDITPQDWGVETYWLSEKQKLVRAFYPLTAEFFVPKTDSTTQKQLLSHPHVDQVTSVSRYLSIHDWKPRPVLCVRVNPKHIRSTYFDIRTHFSGIWDLFNADLSIYQQFCFQTKLFPYAYAEVEIQNGQLLKWKLLETYTQMDYRPVPFKTLWLQPIFKDPHFLYKKDNKIISFILRRSVIDKEEQPVIFTDDIEANLISECIKHIQKVDPDILFTRGGDTFIPVLANHAAKLGLGKLTLGRGFRTLYSYRRQKEGKKGYERYKEGQRETRGHSYISYGRVYFSQYGVYLDGGRHHYDVGNSFMWKDGNIEGIHELVRLGCSDPQRIARGTIGTTLSAVQMRTAYYRNILIPARKADAEAFRPAWSMMSDVGGLVFSPQVGFHPNATELDFLSMYPNIMVRLNVSPETVNCSCCNGRQIVPQTSHHICVKRPGLISLSLKNILDRRAYFKSKKHQSLYDRRQKVLKWLLVTCLEPNTIVPVKENGILKTVRIGSYIDNLIKSKVDLDNISLVGVNQDFRTIFNPIKQIFRVASPSILYNIKLETGREITVTENHRCYILKNGQLVEMRADELEEGDFLPVMLKAPTIEPISEINVLPSLLKASDNDLDKWRIQGAEITHYIMKNKKQIRNEMQNHHSESSMRIWRRNGFIPLRYFQTLNIPQSEWDNLKIGYGRRGGGKIHWLPVQYALDSELAFFLGYFIGDGSARTTFLRLAVNGEDTDLVDWFIQFFSKRFDLSTHVRKESHTNMFTLQVNSAALTRLLQAFDTARTKALGKLKVPMPIFNSSEEAIYGFISGLIASDGNVKLSRNVIRIASCEKRFIEELCYLATRINLYATMKGSKDNSIFELMITGEKNLKKILHKGIVKDVDRVTIEAKKNKIKSRAWVEDFPITESGLFHLAKKARTARNPRLSGRVRTSRTNVEIQIERIQKKSNRLTSKETNHLRVIEKLVTGDIGFAQITEIERIPAKSKYVYCFEVEKEYPGFIAGTGGVFSHNSFGYQGYRNARFGRIEAHETISAYGRHVLTQTQQLAAKFGLETIAGIVDSIWLTRPDGHPIGLNAVEDLRQRVENLTGLPVEHAADYHWIVFLPRRHEPTIGVLNRYYGLKRDGTFKIRGIEIRQSSSPLFVKKMQHEQLKLLAKARTRAQFRIQTKKAKQHLNHYLDRLERKEIPIEELLITIRPSRGPDEYVNNSRQALASRQLARTGITVEPGMKLSFLLVDMQAKNPRKRVKVTQLLRGNEQYDVHEYQKLAKRAYESIIPPEFEEKNRTLESFLFG